MPRRSFPPEGDQDLEKYRLLVELGRGGMGVVSLAVLLGPAGFHKLLALKELRRELRHNPAIVAMFMDEARLAARLNHPNIVQTIEVGTHDGRPFLAMEYLEGQPLRQLVQRALANASRIPLRMHVGILLDVLSALEYAHDVSDFDGTPLGVVHRDVSPHNVVVTYEGQIKLVDFGSSKTDHRADEERPDVVTGKARYMAPEQAAGGRVDRRADLFAVGVMLWEAIVGRRPWEGQPDSVVLRSLKSGVVPRVRDEWPDVDPGLAAIVERAMSVDPEERYPTALAMRNDLERYIGTRNMAPPSARSLGALVARLFADDREQLRVQVDAQLRGFGGAGEGVRSSTLHKLSMTLPVPGASARPPKASSPSSPARGWTGGVLLAVGAAGIGAMLALGAVTAWRLRGGDVSPAAAAPSPVPVVTPSATPAPPVSPAPRPPPIPDPVVASASPARVSHAIIVASPPSARIYLDDVPLSNPYVADRVADALAHRLRVEAPGYETKMRTLTFAADIQLDIDLGGGPAAPPAWRGARPERTVPPADPVRPQAPSTTTRALVPRPIDTGDPYVR